MRLSLSRLGVALLLAAGLPAAASTPSAAQPLPGTGCNLFPADNILNTDISSLPVNSNNATWKSNMTGHANLHPDLGTPAQGYGMPVNVAPPPSTGVTPTFYYDGESDKPPEGYPFDGNTQIEGGPNAADLGEDAHALMVNKNNCKLYELFAAAWHGGNPSAGSGAVWDLHSNAMRPDGWTSGDAAGLPILPLLLRYDEVVAGSITHAIRFTNHCSFRHLWPGSHDATTGGSGCPPMGARFRLRAGFDTSGYSPHAQVVLRAFQHYGLILADNSNGGDWFFQGTQDPGWNDENLINEMKSIPASEFEAVDESALQVQPNSYQAAVTPGAPTEVVAGAGNGEATVSWRHPFGAPFTSFVVTGTPGGAATVGGSASSATITGLANGTTYTFTVTANNQYGMGPASAPSNPVTPNAGGYYKPLNPVRILDTRTGVGAPAGKLGPGQSLEVQVGGASGVDASAAGAAINVTATAGSAPSYLSVFPSGQARPNASNLNFLPGQQIANLVQVALGTGGRVTVYNDQGSADVIFDLNGWYTSSAVAGAAGLYFPLAGPNRILDTRTGLGHAGGLGPSGSLNLQVTGTPGVPASGVAAVVLNLTAVNGSRPSYLSAYPAGGALGSSNVNFPAGRNLPNRVIAKLDTSGFVSIYNSEGQVDVVADVAGYYGDGSGSSAGGVLFHPTPPVRLVDTRPASQVGPDGQPVGPGGVLMATAAGQGLVPVGAAAVSGNFTVTNPTCGSFLTVYPAGGSPPLASDLNFGPYDVLPNLVIVKLGGGAVSAYNNLCSTDLIVDVAGWYG